MMNRIFLITRSSGGNKVKEALERFGRKNKLQGIWELPADLPPLMEEEDVSIPDMSDMNVILSYALHPDINFFLIESLKSTEKVILMP
ncbi:MAG: DUF166 family protein, partial [Candidatus Thorarchaeota archaeon]